MERCVCIHAHCYQPPRENPWLEAIELQDSAYPYHDWNERIAAECYAPNGASRILDGERRIVQIVNNYSKISFNFGPTLLSWLQEKSPDVYEGILKADRESLEHFSGHGSALAQVYNHMIMPLANRRDKYTQALWGLRDFQRRFGRMPEGMWLSETAVDLETLDILAELGIRFTILSPYQASRVRRIGGRAWRDVSGARIDPTMAYEQRLASGRKIALFFYDGPISRAVAFERLLTKGEDFAHRLLSAFSDQRAWPQLVHIATDGESYGHHHAHGDMGLAYALHFIESNGLARITIYGEFLEKHPPTHQVEIFENTAWSCAHAVERWWKDCGCNSGGYPGWNQAWRTPLRNALDWLRDTLAPRYEEHARQFVKDPWAARDDYITVVLDRSAMNVDRFLSEHAARELNEAETITVLKLLELQRHAMLMYTSCGWFFDELSGIETVQVIQYAGRVVQLADELFGPGTEPRFRELLEQAKSNIPEHRDGRHLYEKWVKPAAIDWEQVGAHYAVSSVFEDYAERTEVFCYTVDRDDYQSAVSGKAKFAVGHARVTSQITRDSGKLSFGVFHFGDHNLIGAAREFQGEEPYQTMVQEVSNAFSTGEFPEIIRLLDKHFGESTYSLRSLFRDEQRKVLGQILDVTLASTEAAYRQLYEQYAPLIRFLNNLYVPLPKAIQTAAEFVLNADLRRALQDEEIDLDRIRTLFDEARAAKIALDEAGIGYALREKVFQLTRGMVGEIFADPIDLSTIQKLEASVDFVHSLPFEVDLWKVQNRYYRMMQTAYPRLRERAEQGDESAKGWVDHFVALGSKLAFRVT